MANSDPSQQLRPSAPAMQCVRELARACVCVCNMAWETREWWARSDTWPLRQLRINGHNRWAPLERMWLGNGDFHPPLCLHLSASSQSELLFLDLGGRLFPETGHIKSFDSLETTHATLKHVFAKTARKKVLVTIWSAISRPCSCVGHWSCDRSRKPLLNAHSLDDERKIQEASVSPAVAKEISLNTLVAAVLSELDDIITFESEQMASLEVFLGGKKHFHCLSLCSSVRQDFSYALWCEGPCKGKRSPARESLTHSTDKERNVIGPFHFLWTQLACFLQKSISCLNVFNRLSTKMDMQNISSRV